MVASLEVNTDDGVVVEAEIDGEDLQRYIIIVHLVVTEGNVDVNSMEIFVLNKEFLIDFCGLFKVTSQVMEGSHTKLIFNR